jgi:hypothetical protein
MVDHFRDDLEPVKKQKSKGFTYTCAKCRKVVSNAKSIFTVMSQDLCMECWFETDYKAQK